MENTIEASKLVKSAIKALLNKYNHAWYENESSIEQSEMTQEDYEIYSVLFDAREELRTATNK